ERQVERRNEILTTLRAQRRIEVRRHLVSRALRQVLNLAADVVLAERRALRAAQHFDALGVDDVHQQSFRGAAHDSVDVERHAWNSTHAKRASRATEEVAAVHRDAWHAGIQVLGVLDAAHLDLIAVECSHRDWHLLQILVAPPRLHDDFRDGDIAGVDRCRSRLFCRRRDWRRRGQQRQSFATQSDAALAVDYELKTTVLQQMREALFDGVVAKQRALQILLHDLRWIEQLMARLTREFVQRAAQRLARNVETDFFPGRRRAVRGDRSNE